MFNLLEEIVRPGSLPGVGSFLISFVVYLLLGVLPSCGVIYLVYFLLTLPMRRSERARTFLDLLELGLKEGRTAEAIIVAASETRDRALAVRFHLLAAHIANGLRLSTALERVPRLLPLQITSIIKVGERLGDLPKVLPACRLLLKDSVSQVRSAINYLVMLAFLVSPFSIATPILLKIYVLPSFRAVFEGIMEGTTLPAFTRFVFASGGAFSLVQAGIFSVIWLVTLAYLGGPRLRYWITCAFPGVVDFVLFRLPWRRKRMQRDFSSLLALLLDAGVPEAEAVLLAGECSGNLLVQARAERVRDRLKQGIKLPEAITAIDDSGELRWRLGNAFHRARGFVQALSGWHEALDAKAFQLEQSAAQITTTGLVLINGLIVGCVVIGMFLALINLLNQAVLW